MGHSMGAITSCIAALDDSLPAAAITLVLVAPAIFVGVPEPPPLTPMPTMPAAALPPAATGSEAGAGGGGGSGGAAFAGGAGNSSDGCQAIRAAAVTTAISRPVWSAALRRHVAAGIALAFRAVLWPFGRAGNAFWNFVALPAMYPFLVLLLRSLAYDGAFWERGLAGAWKAAPVPCDAVARYRWPSLVRGWDTGLATYIVCRLRRSGGPRGAAEKAAAGMRLVIMFGADDRVIQPAAVRRLAAHLRSARTIEVADCGHVPHEERPDEFVRLLAAALEES
ncbi:unnamed protein product [Phaeothamnion confervicola]